MVLARYPLPPGQDQVPPSELINTVKTLPSLVLRTRAVILFTITKQILTKIFFFLKFLEDKSAFCGDTHTNILDLWWGLLWVSKQGWIPRLRDFSPVRNHDKTT